MYACGSLCACAGAGACSGGSADADACACVTFSAHFNSSSETFIPEGTAVCEDGQVEAAPKIKPACLVCVCVCVGGGGGGG